MNSPIQLLILYTNGGQNENAEKGLILLLSLYNFKHFHSCKHQIAQVCHVVILLIVVQFQRGRGSCGCMILLFCYFGFGSFASFDFPRLHLITIQVMFENDFIFNFLFLKLMFVSLDFSIMVFTYFREILGFLVKLQKQN